MKKKNIHNGRLTTRNLIIFTVLVLGSAVLAGFIEPLTIPPDAEPGSAGLGQLLWIISPFAVMVLLRLFGGDGWADLGLRVNFKGNGFWWLVSILIFPLTIALTTALGLVLGGLAWNPDLLPAVFMSLVPALLAALIKNIFEEFAWRGYLAPKLYSLNINLWVAHALVGVIWTLWHLPFVYVFWTYLTPGMLWYFIPLLLVGLIAQSIVYGEIRLATSSAVPAWVMHTIGNTLGNALLLSGFLQMDRGWELIASPGSESILSIILMFFIGYWLHRQRTKAEIT